MSEKETKTVLIVDDSKTYRIKLQIVLKDGFIHNYDFLFAEDGDTGLRLCEEHAPDCILLDYLLPDMNGLEFLWQLKAADDPTAVIMITGRGDEEIGLKAIELGAQDFFTKDDVASERLHYQVHNAIQRSSLQKHIREQVQSLARTNQELDDFSYIVSHDLREPLRGISHYSHRLIDDYSGEMDEEGKGLLDSIHRLTGKLDSQIESILQYSRTNRKDLVTKSVPIGDIVQSVLETLEITIKEKGIDVRIPDELPTITCDPVMVYEVFHNLISNAMKYNDKDNPWIEIGFTQEEGEKGRGIFHVKDNGIGIKESHFEKVFVMFRRLHGRDKFGGGTGAGLSFVQKIIQRHNGEIWIESPHSDGGEGTAFFFTIGILS